MLLTLDDFTQALKDNKHIKIFKYMIEDINHYIAKNVGWEEIALHPNIRVDTNKLIITSHIFDDDKSHIKSIHIEYYFNDSQLCGWDFQTIKA